MPTTNQYEAEARFIAALRHLAPYDGHKNLIPSQTDRQALAILRRSLGRAPGMDINAYPYVIPYAPYDTYRQDVYFLVAGLFALYPDSTAEGEGFNLGASWERLKRATDSDSIEQRFIVLLSSAREMLPDHLRHAITLLKSKNIAIDWHQLLIDLRYWDAGEHRIQRAWAQSYWRKSTEATDEVTSTANTTDEV